MKGTLTMHRKLLCAALVTGLVGLGCEPLRTLEPNECGNGVIDAKERCDSVAIDGFTCREAGQPFECQIECDENFACPSGYGCGTNGICNPPNGAFSSSSFFEAPSQAHTLLTGDFDNDRRSDIVAIEPGKARIYFANPTGDLARQTVGSPLPPSVGKLGALIAQKEDKSDLDTTDDLILPTSIGIGALLAQESRSFVAKTYSAITFNHLGANNELKIQEVLPLSWNGLPGADSHSGDETVALLKVAPIDPDTGTPLGNSVNLLASFESIGTPLGVVMGDDTVPSSVVGSPIAANFDKDACEELAFALRQKPVIRILKFCKNIPGKEGFQWNKEILTELGATVATIQLPEPIAGPAFARDVNGDGNMDIIAAVREQMDSALKLAVAYGDGDGGFSGALGDVPSKLVMAGILGEVSASTLLDAVDLNGDKVIDLVIPAGVFKGSVKSTGEVGFVLWYKPQRAWSEAVISDINGDGTLDIVAAAGNATDIDLLLRPPTEPFFNPSELATDGAVSHLALGDYDGDLVQDIAFGNKVDDETGLMVAFGRTYGGPEDPIEMGRFHEIDYIVSGDVHSFGVDGISDLGVLGTLPKVRSGEDEETPTDDPQELSFFPGTASRLMLAPFLLVQDSGFPELPLATATGFFALADGDAPGRRDLAALSFNAATLEETPEGGINLDNYLHGLHVWGLRGANEEGDFDKSQSASCTIEGGGFVPGLQDPYSVAFSETSIDKPGRVFISAPIRVGTSTVISENLVSSAIFEADFGNPGVCSLGSPWISNPGELYYRARTAQIDDDPAPEILAIRVTFDAYELRDYAVSALGLDSQDNSGSGRSVAPPTPMSSQLVIFWNGDLTNEPFVLPDEITNVTDFAVDDWDKNGHPDLLISAQEVDRDVYPTGALFRYAWNTDLHELRPILFSGPALNGATALAIGDVDGDGIDDLIVESGSLEVFQGLSKGESTGL